MLLYNVTVSIQHERETEWVDWMRNHHIQDVLDTGFFVEAKMFKQVEPAPQPGTTTYCISYQCPSQEALETYQRDAAPALQADHTERFQGHFSASRVVLSTLA